MKQRYYLLLPSAALLLYFLAFTTLIHWSPSDTTAAWAWNLGLAFAPVLALWAQLRLARERGLSPVLTMSVIAVMNTAIVLGSRLGAWSAADWNEALYSGNLPELPGKTAMGGLLLGLGLFFVLKRWWKLPYSMADVLAIGLPLAAAAGRTGCLVAGCCFGTASGAGFGICYGPGTPAFEHQSAVLGFAPASGFTTPLFPVQLLFIAGDLLIFMFLWHFRKRFSQTGVLALLSLGLLMTQRFGLEFLRDAVTNRGELGRYFAGLKWVQWQSLFIAVPAFAGLVYLLVAKKNAVKQNPGLSNDLRLWPQAFMICLILGAAYFIRPLMTLDELMVILLSCLPALAALGYAIWTRQLPVEQRFASMSLLSIGFMLLIGPAADSTMLKPGPDSWTRWFEIGGGASFGQYNRKVVSRDCNGNVTNVTYQHMDTQFGGGHASINWEKGSNHLQVQLMGTGGNVSSNDSNDQEDNNQFSVFGIAGRYEGRLFGMSLGVLNQNRTFAYNAQGTSQDITYWPVVDLRIGAKDKFAVDLKIFDEPGFSPAMQPPLSFGMRWGFGDESGKKYVRTALAVTNTGGAAFNLGGEFPLGERGLFGIASGYVGNLNMLTLGLKYRFGERQNY